MFGAGVVAGLSQKLHEQRVGAARTSAARLSRVVSFGERDARATGVALAGSRTDDIVDAGVVVGAGVRGDAIVTSDPRDLAAAAAAAAIGVSPPLHVI